MPLIRPVFDVNVYEGMTRAAAMELRQRERQLDVLPIAAIWPVMEMLAHLADRGDPDFGRSLAGLQKLYGHTRADSLGSTHIPLLIDFDAQLVSALFGQKLYERVNHVDRYAKLIGVVAEQEAEKWSHDVTHDLEVIRKHVADKEHEFAVAMRDKVKQMDPSAVGWKPFANEPELKAAELTKLEQPDYPLVLALNHVRLAAEMATARLGGDELLRMAASVAKAFPAGLMFERLLMQSLINGDVDFSKGKHANSLWDSQLCFYASPAAATGGCPTLLVTNEKKFRNAADKVGHGGYVLSLSEYRDLVSTGRITEVAERLSVQDAV